MTCASCAAALPTTAGTADRLDAVLASFWPPGVPFPPMAPYVAAVVSRSDLRRCLPRQWALDGADKDAGVLARDPTAILSLLGQAMTDPSLVYAAARKKRKGKGSTPGSNLLHGCSVTCSDGRTKSVTCGDGERCVADVQACTVSCEPLYSGGVDPGDPGSIEGAL